MKVYIVMEEDIDIDRIDTTYYIVDCVFDTREKANDYIKEREQRELEV